MKTNIATYRTQKVAGSWIAESDVYLSVMLRCDFAKFLLIMKELRMTSQAVCPESIEVIRRPDLIPASCRHALPVRCNLVTKLVKSQLP